MTPSPDALAARVPDERVRALAACFEASAARYRRDLNGPMRDPVRLAVNNQLTEARDIATLLRAVLEARALVADFQHRASMFEVAIAANPHASVARMWTGEAQGGAKAFKAAAAELAAILGPCTAEDARSK
jgi:hypothetical protein